MYAARGLYVSLDMCSWNVSLHIYLCICFWMYISRCVSVYISLEYVPEIYLVYISLNMFLWFVCVMFSSLCLVSTLKNDQSKCNEAYQTLVTSNIRLISFWVTRKVSSVLLNYILKVEQELRLLNGDSRMCRSHYISKDKVR